MNSIIKISEEEMNNVFGGMVCFPVPDPLMKKYPLLKMFGMHSQSECEEITRRCPRCM